MAEFSQLMMDDLETTSKSKQLPEDQKNIEAGDAVKILQERLNQSFAHPTHPLTVKLSD